MYNLIQQQQPKWTCPICGRVYTSKLLMCFYCCNVKQMRQDWWNDNCSWRDWLSSQENIWKE